MQKHKNTIMLVVAFVLVAGISFYGGTQYAQSNPSSGQAQFGANGGFRGGMMGGRGGSRNSAGFATGQVISKDDQSITLKLMNGGSKIVFLSAQTSVMKAVAGVIADLAQNQYVTVSGTPNADGSITAESVQIRPTPPVQPNGTQQTSATK